MATHLLRDYQNQKFNAPTGTPDQIIWLASIFCRRVLGYTHVGNTNWDLDSSTYLKASGTGVGQRAGINFGANFRYEVSIPLGVRAVTVQDVGRMLVLRSTANPRHNSGIFLITGLNVADNRYIIDYRSTDDPPAEAVDSMPWWIYETDNVFPNNRTTPGGVLGEYRSHGAACTCSRVVLQSPHSTGWQVRFCMEHELDWRNGFVANSVDVTNIWTIAPGFGGTSIGDFPVGGEHVHSPMWWNTNDRNRCGQQPGLGNVLGFAVLGQQEQFRITMIGDDEGHGVYIVVRRPFGPVPFGVFSHWQFQFGLCENEPTPLPVRPVRRLFCMGNNSPTNSSQVSILNVANSFHYHGLTQGFNGQPVTANLANWSYIETNAAVQLSNSGAPFYNSNGGDNPFTQALDLLPVEVVAGFGENWFNATNNRVHQFEPRLMGTLPFVKSGRSTFPMWTTTTDLGWYHLTYGVYALWGGPATLP
jgi:hypothetical protein